MSDDDFSIVCSKIDEEVQFLNEISQKIWENPELSLKEVQARNILTKALEQHGFIVTKNYVLPTAFKAEFSSKTAAGPTIAILLEYDALPDLGHACGHNLIAEAGLAAGIGIKAAMEADATLGGKLLIVGTPAEEQKGGKIHLLNAKTFDEVDAAMMVHPEKRDTAFPPLFCHVFATIDFKGKEAHAAAFPWEGRNALDAAVTAYQSFAFMKQHIKPSCKIHAIITNGGTRTNIIPAHTSMELSLRASTMGELNRLKEKIDACITCSATSAGCTATIQSDPADAYENLISNRVMGDLYTEYAKLLGLSQMGLEDGKGMAGASSDMGNVSHVVPSIQPFFDINTEASPHMKEFADAAGSPKAQKPTLIAAKAMALTALKLMRFPKVLEEVKKQFKNDISEENR